MRMMHEIRSSDQHMGNVMMLCCGGGSQGITVVPVGVAKPMELDFNQAAAASLQRETRTR